MGLQTQIKYQLPRVYHKLFPQELLTAKIQETKANCSACNKAPVRNTKAPFYRDDLKCCTFYPYMPNYLVGNFLRDKHRLSEPIRQTVDAIIADRKYSLPIGFVAPIPYQLEFNKRKPEDFGNRRDWLCPYYQTESNNCGIWQWRGSVCTSFFCDSSYGKNGINFWSEMNNYLSYIEMALMEEALVNLDFSPRQISDLLMFLNVKKADAKDRTAWTLSVAQSKKLWNGYYDDQERFFIKCLDIVEKMNRRDFNNALGETGERLFEKLSKSMKLIF